MSQRVDLTRYFTRKQSDFRYLLKPQTPSAPTSVSVSGTGLAGATAWVDLAIVPAATPDSAFATASFEITYQITWPAQHAAVITTLPVVTPSIYRLSNIAPGAKIAIVIRAVGITGLKSIPSPELNTTVATDSLPPAAPVITAQAAAQGAEVDLSGLNLEADFAFYELWRAKGETVAPPLPPLPVSPPAPSLLKTSLAAETENNTSAYSGYKWNAVSSPDYKDGSLIASNFVANATSDISGNPTPKNVSKRDVHELCVNGSLTMMIAHWMGWFGVGQPHIDVGYDSDTLTQVAAQVTDMVSRGINALNVEWYGIPNLDASSTHVNNATLKMKAECEKRPGFLFSLMITEASISKRASTVGVTQAVIDNLTYADTNYFNSPNYWKIGGRPVFMIFDKVAGVDYVKVRAAGALLKNGIPLLLFRHDWTTGDGAFAWFDTTNDGGLGVIPPKTSYLTWFYNNAKANPTKISIGACYVGFNGNLTAGKSTNGSIGNGWSKGQVVERNNGETWLDCFDVLNTSYPAGRPLSFLQIPTWNDDQEGTGFEFGIDNALTTAATIAGSMLNWSIAGNERTVSEYRIYWTVDAGVTLNLLQVVPTTAPKVLSLANLPPGDYQIYVQACGKPGIFNQMSAPVAYTLAPPALGAISGRIIDSVSGLPLAGVSCQTDSGITATSNSTGNYSLPDVGSGSRTVTYTLTGYAPLSLTVTVNGGVTSAQDVQLATLASGEPGSGQALTAVIWEPSPVMNFDTSQAIDVSIPEEADYYYKVRALDFSGNSADSNIVGPIHLLATTHPVPAALDLSSGQAVSNESGAIQLSWTPSSEPYLVKYNIYRQVSGSMSWVLIASPPALPHQPLPYFEYLDTTAVLGTTYQYAITVVTVSAESAFPATPFTATSSQTAMYPVANIVIRGILGGIYVSWDPSASGAYAYAVNWRLSASSPWQDTDVWVTANNIQVLGLTETREQLANQLEVRVIAIAQIASDPVSKIADFPSLIGYRPADATIPAAPDIITVAVSNDGSVTLTWPAPGAPDISGYQIEKRINDAGNWLIIDAMTDNQPGTKQFQILGLEPYVFDHKQYRFRVRTIDTSGNISSPNKVINPGFETGELSDWLAVGDSAPAVVNQASNLTMNGSAFAVSITYTTRLFQLEEVAAGDVYTLTVNARRNGVDTNASILIRWYDAVMAQLGPDVIASLAMFDVYQQLKLEAQIAPAGAAFCHIGLLGDMVATTSPVLYDNVQFEASMVATTYADGKTALVRAVDTTGPQDYTLNLAARGQLGQIDLTWKNPDAYTAGSYDYNQGTFEIFRQVTSSAQPSLPVDADYRKIQEVAAAADGSANGWSDMAPDEALHITAQYKIRGKDRFGNSGPFLNGGVSVSATSQTADDKNIITHDGQAPPVPDMTLAHAVAQNDGSIKIDWAGLPTTDLVGYNIWRKSSSDSSFTLARTVSKGASPGSGETVICIDSGLTLGQTYTYAVEAVDRAGNASGFDAAHAVSAVAGDVLTPLPPATVTGRGATGRIDLTWAPSTTVGVERYGVQYSVDGGNNYTAIANVIGTFFSIPLANGGSSTWVKANVRAQVWSMNRSANGYSATSTSMSLLGDNDLLGYVPMDSTPPDPPTAFAGTANPSGDVILSWTAPVASDVDHYLIETQYGSGPWQFQCVVPAGTTNYRIAGLQPYLVGGTMYNFRITAVDTSNHLSNPPQAFGPIAIQMDDVPPAVPTGLTGLMPNDPTGGNATANISWSENSEPDLYGYELLFELSSGAGNQTVVFTPKGSPFYAVHSLLQATNYNFQVRAVDKSNNRSAYTAALVLVSAASSTGTPPSAVSSFSATYDSTNNDVVLDLSAYSKPADFFQYIIKRNTSSSEGAQVGTSTGTDFTDTGARAATSISKTYYYVVRVQDTSGNVSDASPIVSVTIPASGDPNSNCVEESMFVKRRLQAKDAEYFSLLDVVRRGPGGLTELPLPIRGLRKDIWESCVEVRTENGCVWRGTHDTHVDMIDGSDNLLANMDGQLFLTRVYGMLEWSRAAVRDIGLKKIVRISLGGETYAAGEDPDFMVFTHNVQTTNLK